jgi:hypothetical protein
MARETGCMELALSRAASCKASDRASEGAVITSRSTTRSCVSVPVLSKTTLFTSDKVSNACRRRTRMPLPARAPAEASMAAGVARDKAQGR